VSTANPAPRRPYHHRIEFGGGIATDFVGLGRTALVTVTGPIDGPALRAVVPGLRLVALTCQSAI
jgi:hypothetical protein